MRKLCFAFCFSALLGGAWADDYSGPGRTTLVNEDWGTIYCKDNCAVRSDVSGRIRRLTTDEGPISLSQAADGWLIQAPNQNLRLRRYEGIGGRRLLVTFNSASYVFENKQNDYLWEFPGNKVFFNLREGELRGALGPEGAFKMHKKHGGVAYEIDSEAGQSQVLLGRKKIGKKDYRYVVVQQSGEELARHPYMVRGVLFDNGPVGIFIKMPRNPVLDALDWTMVKAIPSAVPFPAAKVVEAPVKERDPLQAIEASRDEDPNGLKRMKSEKYRDMKNPAPPDTNGNTPTWTIPPK